MWVLIKKTYAGPLGLFEGGAKKDLPESLVKKLPRRFYIKTRAPWDENKDIDVCELVRLGRELKRTTDAGNNLWQSARDYRIKAEQLIYNAEACEENGRIADKECKSLQIKIEKLEQKIETKKAKADNGKKENKKTKG